MIERVHYQYYVMFNQTISEYQVFRNDEMPLSNKSGCASEDVFDYQPDMHNVSNPSRRSLRTSKRFVNLYIVTDNLRRQYLNNDRNLLYSSTINIATLVKDIYASYKNMEYPIQVDIGGIHHLPETATPYPWETKTDPTSVLFEFNLWATQNNKKQVGRTVMLITGMPLSGGVIGIAYMSTICSGGVAISESVVNDYGTAKTVAHELGHNLGMRHITNYVSGSSLGSASEIEDCRKQFYSIMSPVIYGTNYVWDRCSYEWFKLFNEGYPYGCTGSTCTFYPSMREGCLSTTQSECGNTVLNEGEECDCGNEEECDDPCCDPKTCRIIGQCSPNVHACCTTQCTVAPKIQTCREAKHEQCDRAETCDGVSRDCPKDVSYSYIPCQAPNFSKTKQLAGKCFKGDCLSHDIQCLNVNPAYGLNLQGSCIRGVNGTVACQKLFCQPATNAFCTVLYAPTLQYVKDGTSCGDDLICMNQQCVSIVPTTPSAPSSNMPTIRETKHPVKPFSRPTTTKRPTTVAPTLRPSLTKAPTPKPTRTKAPTSPPSLTKAPTPKPSRTKAPTLPPRLTKAPTPRPSRTKAPTLRPSLTKRPTPRPSRTKAPTLRPSLTKRPTPRPSRPSSSRTKRPTNRPWYCSEGFKKLYPSVKCEKEKRTIEYN